MPHGTAFLISPLIETLLVLASSLRLLATLDTGTLIMLSLADLGENAGAGARTFEAPQRAVQRLIVLDSDF